MSYAGSILTNADKQLIQRMVQDEVIKAIRDFRREIVEMLEDRDDKLSKKINEQSYDITISQRENTREITENVIENVTADIMTKVSHYMEAKVLPAVNNAVHIFRESTSDGHDTYVDYVKSEVLKLDSRAIRSKGQHMADIREGFTSVIFNGDYID